LQVPFLARQPKVSRFHLRRRCSSSASLGEADGVEGFSTAAVAEGATSALVAVSSCTSSSSSESSKMITLPLLASRERRG
jgi:hypothetical protein